MRDRLGRTSPDTLNATYQLARALFAAKQLDEAREVARTAFADITASRGADYPDAVEFHNHLGKIAAELGQLDEARQEFERALAITRAAYGDTQVTADSTRATSPRCSSARIAAAKRRSSAGKQWQSARS